MSEPDQPLDVTAVDVDEARLSILLREQFPELAGLPVRVLGPWGTDNAMFRLGDDLLARLPRRGWAKESVAKEVAWLPHLRAQGLPVALPDVVGVGAPSAKADYPWTWAVLRWLPGVTPTPATMVDGASLAADIGRFVEALAGVEDVDGGPVPGVHNGYRGGAFRRRDRWVRPAIASPRHSLDKALLTAFWEDALRLSPWPGRPAWLHGDLTPSNLLVDERGRLSAVIDWGCLAVGDPACDLMVAWNFDDRERSALRSHLTVDEETWARGRAAAFWQWVGGLDDEHPDNEARRVIGRVIADFTR